MEENTQSGEPQGQMPSGDQPQRQTYKGDWSCSKCGAKITELPFEPDPARMERLLCRDCYRSRAQSFRQ